MFERLRLRKQLLQLKVATAQEKLATQQHMKTEAMLRLCPHYYLPTAIYTEGGKWICELEECHEHQQGVIAYGDSPLEACMNFDKLWREGYGPEMEEAF